MSGIKILGKVDLEQVDPKHIKLRKEREAKEARAKAAEEKLAQINARLNAETRPTVAVAPREPWKKLQFQQDYLQKRVFGEYPKDKLPESIDRLSHSQKIKDGVHPAPLHKRRELAEKLPAGVKRGASYKGETLMHIK